MKGNAILVPVTRVTEAGYPKVSWTQQIPVTSKGMQDIRKAAIGSAIVVVLALAAFASSAPGEGWAGFAILVWGLIVVAFRSGAPRGWKWEDWGRKPVTVDCAAQAFLANRGDALHFVWRFRTQAGDVFGDEVPLESFSIFEVARLSDWLTSPQDDVRYETGEGVFIHVQNVGPRCVAVHYGAPAELSSLHDHLTNAFINRRPALHAHLKPRAVAPMRGGDDDVPQTL